MEGYTIDNFQCSVCRKEFESENDRDVHESLLHTGVATYSNIKGVEND